MKRSEVLIADLVTPTVEALGLALWGVEHVSQGKFSLLRIYIDRADDGVTVDDCAMVSNQVSALLDVEEPISGEYTLEVSSPGLDRPLFTLPQFEQYVGDPVSIRTRGPVDGRRKFKGTIAEVVNDAVVVTVDGVDYKIPHGEIEKAAIVFE
ncbi:MAG: ribosome maturation factor RimP [Pseudohongiellaceae bacterium]